MPKNPEPEGSPRLLTIDQIAAKHGVSRSTVHTYRRGGTFPRPIPVEGTTRVLFDADEVAAWFLANPKQQGRRTDRLAKKQTPEESKVKTYILIMRIEAGEDVNEAQIREEVYDACRDVPFGFDITSIEGEQG